MATHSSILAWRIPWREEPGRLHPWCCNELDMAEQLTLSLHVLIKAVHYPEQYFHIPMRKEVIQSGK